MRVSWHLFGCFTIACPIPCPITRSGFEGIGSAILGLAATSNSDDDTGTIASGSTLVVVAISIILYAMRTFWWRAKMIKERKEGPFYVSTIIDTPVYMLISPSLFPG
jgi:hypothetical protein